jgi:hypothetical protein
MADNCEDMSVLLISSYNYRCLNYITEITYAICFTIWIPSLLKNSGSHVVSWILLMLSVVNCDHMTIVISGFNEAEILQDI